MSQAGFGPRARGFGCTAMFPSKLWRISGPMLRSLPKCCLDMDLAYWAGAIDEFLVLLGVATRSTWRSHCPNISIHIQHEFRGQWSNQHIVVVGAGQLGFKFFAPFQDHQHEQGLLHLTTSMVRNSTQNPQPRVVRGPCCDSPPCTQTLMIAGQLCSTALHGPCLSWSPPPHPKGCLHQQAGDLGMMIISDCLSCFEGLVGLDAAENAHAFWRRLEGWVNSGPTGLTVHNTVHALLPSIFLKISLRLPLEEQVRRSNCCHSRTFATDCTSYLPDMWHANPYLDVTVQRQCTPKHTTDWYISGLIQNKLRVRDLIQCREAELQTQPCVSKASSMCWRTRAMNHHLPGTAHPTTMHGRSSLRRLLTNVEDWFSLLVLKT